MTVVGTDEDGLRQAGRALDRGDAVVLPLPAPLPYLVAAADPAAANVAKGRPADQPVGSAVADLALVAPYVELDDDTLAFARWLSAEEMLNLFLPVVADGPAWLRPSTSNGLMGVMLSWLGATRRLLDERGHLYVSSGNRTGGEVAVTAAAADAAFGGELLVLDGDVARAGSAAYGSATIVRVGRQRRLDVVRHGVNDADLDTDVFLRRLTDRWESRRRS